MKKKIVLRMQPNGDGRMEIFCAEMMCWTRVGDITKAMRIASSTEGVISVAKKGEDQIEVVGNGIDSVKLTNTIRKKVRGYVSLESVEEVKEKKEEPKKEEPKKTETCLLATVPFCNPPYYMYQTVYDPNPQICSIL